ncbi:hypothetical protein SDC9_47975 [bioreactor metagenome]|uniref:Uncharacterized protein n=1 Tax=bioreactor metagenome TaxID=1076179 RepID=A0A644WD43_9ZZZZ
MTTHITFQPVRVVTYPGIQTETHRVDEKTALRFTFQNKIKSANVNLTRFPFQKSLNGMVVVA